VSAVLCSAAMLTVRKIGKRESPLVLAMWFHSFSSCTGLLALALRLQRVVLPGAVDTLYLVAIAVTSFVGQYALNKSYQMLPASYAAGLSYVQVAWGYCLGIFTLHEGVNRFRCVVASVGPRGRVVVDSGWRPSAYVRVSRSHRRSQVLDYEGSDGTSRDTAEAA